jgi:hypothetical protein
MNLVLLKQVFSKKTDDEKIHILFDDLLLFKPITNIFQKQSNGSSINQRIELLKVLLAAFLFEKKKPAVKASSKKSGSLISKDLAGNEFLSLIKSLLAEKNVHNFIRVNEFEGTTYFNKERFEELLKWILLFHLIEIPSQINDRQADVSKLKKTDFEKEIVKISKENFEKFIELINKAESSGYDFTKFQKELSKENEKKVKTKPINKKRKKI